MVKLYLNIFILIICLCVQAKALASIYDGVSTVDQHLIKYQNINQTHHDNIDDEPHTHSHKHSEDGEEHEHHHGTRKISNSEFQIYNLSKISFTTPFLEVNKSTFLEKSLVSKFFPNTLFKPPIC
ncbi:hypothetical protein DAY19_08105 [Halobacteriovorax vibrionivorans]|uniref:Uncharacterized protein n=1 Tax=Halobacteriovorax vibrionivorans TaxID=2152716 RepID=A0ABY0IG81_9BACT|nr:MULTISPECIES: hypothetical protein [Halobacteriovorax]RZF21642.1 hypothetical protein DAY19_08105 [Halobacteriovorax vibrionivorans]TGD49065.1 hypothetical protein EP118_00945 [Halobacteriovorax sp. Y22]